MIRFPYTFGLAAPALACFLLGGAAPAEDKESPHAALIGKLAPEIKTGFTLNGKLATLADLKGKVVMLDFWAVWCGPCVSTFPHLREWNEAYNKKGLEIVGLTSYYKNLGFDPQAGRVIRAPKPLTTEQEQDMLKVFVKHHKLAHRIVAVPMDDLKGVYESYKVTGIPEAVLIDRKGNVRMVKVGSGEANAKALEEEIKKLIEEKE